MQSSRGLSLTLVALTCLLALTPAGVASAQGRMNTGEISVNVHDADGAALPGATLTLQGVGLVQEAITEASGVDGSYRFRNLRPGAYRLVVAAPGFESATFEDILVRVGQTTTISARMEIAGITETVTVLSQTPLIETASSQISTAYSEQLIQNLPLPRDFIAVGDLTAGITDRGAYGAGGNIEGRYRVGSATSNYKLNGVDVTEPFWGNTFINPSIDTIAEVQVVGIGASAEYGNFTGATVNLVTKSGTNEYHGAASFYHTSSGLIGENTDEPDLKHPDVRYDQDMAFSLGGPVVKRELLFFANASWVRLAEAPYESEQYLDHDRVRFHGRLDWLAGTDNTFGAMYNADPARDENLGLTVARPDPDIGYSVDFGSQTWLVSWQSMPSAATFIDVRYSGYKGHNDTIPNVCCDLSSLRDGATQNRYGSSGLIDAQDNSRNEVDAALTTYVSDFLGAGHDLKVGVEYEDTFSGQHLDLTGGVSLFAYSYGPYTFVYGYTYSSHHDSNVKRLGAYVQDDVAITDRLNVNIGLRYDRPRIFDAFEGRDVEITAFENLGPRFGVSYDFSGRGTLVARSSYGRYHEKALVFGPLNAAGDVFEPDRFYLLFLFEPLDYDTVDVRELQDLVVRPENLLFEGPAPMTPLDPDLRNPRTDVFSVGLQAGITDDFVLSLDYIHKRDRDFIIFEDRNAAQHTYSPVEFTDSLGGTQTLYRRTDSVPGDLWVTNADYYERNHHLATLSFERRPSNDFSFLSSLTYQRSTGVIENDIRAAWGFGSTSEHTSPNFNGHPYTEGLVTFERTWQLKVLGSYQLPGDVRVAGYYTWQSGRPWTPTARTARLLLNDIPPTGSMRIEPRGNRRWEATNTLDLRAQKSFDLRMGGRETSIDLIVDVFNVFNDAAPLRVGTAENATYPLSGESAFGQPLALSAPREARLGIRFVF